MVDSSSDPGSGSGRLGVDFPDAGSSDEFYTGYLPTAPPGIARRVRQAALLLFALTLLISLAMVFGQKGFSSAIYEFLEYREFEGVVREEPYPTLALKRPGRAGEDETSRVYLVGQGKVGADVDVAGLDGKRVKLRGSLLYQEDQTMIEVVTGSVEPLGVETGSATTMSSRETSLGRQTLQGRIIDSKCYLGIMKPGSTKPHRACAALCIAGGIPPLFLLSDQDGATAYLMLVGAEGESVNREVLSFVDEPLEISGEVARLDDLWILKADPATYRRLP